jgi:hypothetical protein
MGVAPRTYTLFCDPARTEPPGGVKVTAVVPPEWTEVGDGAAVRLALPSIGGRGPVLALLPCHGDDDRARIAWALAQQLGSDLPAAAQLERSGGRLWVVHRRPTGHVHARLYVPAPAIGGFVTAVLALGPAQSAHLPEIEAVLDTVRVA